MQKKIIPKSEGSLSMERILEAASIYLCENALCTRIRCSECALYDEESLAILLKDGPREV